MTPEDLTVRFAFHPAKDEETQMAHEKVRALCLNLAGSLNDFLPEGREKALAITQLEQVMFWSNAAIARFGQFPSTLDGVRDDIEEERRIDKLPLGE